MSPIVIAPVPEPPKALALVVPKTVPALIVNPPVKVLTPDKVNCDVALFWMTPVTLVPMTELMVVVPLPAPELVIVPILLIETVERVVVLVFVVLIITLPVPVMPPDNVNVLAALIVKLLFSVIAPLKVALTVLVILNVPLLPEATMIGLAIGEIDALNAASALPLVFPIVIVPVPEPPKALVLTEPVTIPALMVKPPVKVLAPERPNPEVALFWITPVTLRPITALIPVAPVPEPEFVIVPILLMDVVVIEIVPVPVVLVTTLPVPVMPPDIISPPPLAEEIVKLLFNVTAPLRKTALPVAFIVSTPLVPEAVANG